MKKGYTTKRKKGLPLNPKTKGAQMFFEKLNSPNQKKTTSEYVRDYGANFEIGQVERTPYLYATWNTPKERVGKTQWKKRFY